MPITIKITQTITIEDLDSKPNIQASTKVVQPDVKSNTNMPSAFVPSSISAVESNQRSILFYARPDGDLASLTAQKSGEDPSYPDYKSANVILDGNTVSATVPQVSAVAYNFAGSKQIRLYYIGGPTGAPTLKELAKTGDGEWKEGALNKLRLAITPDSLISANVEDDVGDLKVFYNSKDDDDVTVPTVAWVTKGQTAWSSRIIGKWR
ncbi:MAG: hypothetical protein Q9167_007521 [Letrouitia subvulpina]